MSSHRSFIAKCEVIQLSSSEGLSSKGNVLVLFLFSDQLEVCKKRSKALTLKSPNTVAANGLYHKTSIKPYKHVKLMPLNTIKRVIDIKETEDCQKVFSLVFRNNEELKERLFSFAMAEEDADKASFLKTLARQMANNACTADAVSYIMGICHYFSVYRTDRAVKKGGFIVHIAVPCRSLHCKVKTKLVVLF